MFGELGFFSQKSRLVTLKSTKVTTVAQILYQDFIMTLKKYPRDLVLIY